MYSNSYREAPEPSYLNWDLQRYFISQGVKQLAASNFQDVFNLTRRVGDLEVKMNRVKFRAQGVGGMLGIAAGAMGGPLGSILGFGIGRSIGGFAGNVLANKYYGQEQASVNEYLSLAKQRDTQLKYQVGMISALGSLMETFTANQMNDDKKVIQDMMVL